MAKNINPEAYRESLRWKILQVAMREFMSKGIRAVKMDDIAYHLTISKRTLYEVYSNKEVLLLESIRYMEEQNNRHMMEFSASKEYHVIDILMEFYHMQMDMLSHIIPEFLLELHRYPLVMEYIGECRKLRDIQKRDFFQRGVADGYFRADVDYEIVSRIGEASMNHVMESRMYNDYELKHIFRNIILLFIRGFCTEKGIAEIDMRMKEEKE